MTIERILEDRENELEKLSDWYERVFSCIEGNDYPVEMVDKLNRVHARRKAKIYARFVEMVKLL